MKRLTSAAIAAGLWMAWSAPALAVPNTLSFAGRLADDSGPVTGTVQLEFELYDAKSGGTLYWEETHFGLDVDDGLLYASLGSVDAVNNALDLSVFTGAELYLQILVDGESLGPRAAITSVPYAQHAARAELLGDYLPADLQERVAGICAAGSAIREIAADGTVTCETDDVGSGGSSYTAGSGLLLGGTEFSVDTAAVQSRVGGSCTAGSYIRAVAADGTVTCETDSDTNTTYSAGAGISLAGDAFSADMSVVQARVGATCAAGSAIRAIAADGTVTCQTDTDTNTTYAAAVGGGLILSGNEFRIGMEGVSSDMITKNAITSWQLAGSAVSSGNIAPNAVRRSHLNGTENAVYKQSAGCFAQGSLNLNVGCYSSGCSGGTYRSCSGACNQVASLYCPNAHVGYLLAPDIGN